MILSELKLENFKQFRDPLSLKPPEGAIGVVGPNGSGKTTLFEAILWAFFGAKAGGQRFSNDSIPWSGGSTADRSLVEVTLDVGGTSYTVSRSLHRSKATAFVHDADGVQITSGPNDVSNWVQEQLLEMDRVAFDATFFARQKELAFFAGTTGVSRQREVARMLGIDQVEGAQKLLKSDRNGIRAHVSHIEQMLDSVDFDALEGGLKEQRRLRDALKERAAGIEATLETRAKSLEEARAEDARLEKLYREHNRLSSELGKATSNRDRAAERVATLEAQLRRMDEDEKRVRELEPQAKGLPEVEAEIVKLEESRRREERLESAKKDLNRVRREAHDAAMEAADLLEELPANDDLLPGWSRIEDEEDDLEQARLAAEILEDATPAHTKAANHLEALKKTKDLHESLAVLNERLEKAAEHIRGKDAEVKELEGQISALTGGGTSLDERISELRGRDAKLRNESSERMGQARATDEEARKLARAREMIETSDEHARCPTCQRGYEADEHTEVIESIRRQEEELSRRAAAAREECRRLDGEAAKTQKAIEGAEKSRKEAAELSQRWSGASSKLDIYIERRDGLIVEAEEIQSEISGETSPTPDELDEAGAAVQRLLTLRDARPRLLGLLSSCDRSRATAAEMEREVERLSGGTPFDPERHEKLTGRRSEILTIKGNLETLRSSLKDRPESESKLETETESRKTAAATVTDLEAKMKELGFEEEHYEKARRTVSEAERLRDESREEKSVVERELHDAEGRISTAERELSRHVDQRKVADERAKEAASLGSMDGLFTEFYRELTARVRPQLQREASDLVSDLTDGRYTQMEFDENYGVRLYDGLSDAYEISRFSGGEADIASLCARVALSKMISGKGAGALGFIVLDEVFGALDADRRRNVLVALERLKATFGQIFMISHVADVQESALLDETWFIEEDDEGKSYVRRVSHDLGDAPVKAYVQPDSA